MFRYQTIGMVTHSVRRALGGKGVESIMENPAASCMQTVDAPLRMRAEG